ncbi:hypothetical protein T484DRAFT_1629413, partial [Baffinella frigidus]
RSPKPETRSPKPETRSPIPETRNPKPDTRNPKPEARSPKPETRNPKPETRNPESRRRCARYARGGSTATAPLPVRRSARMVSFSSINARRGDCPSLKLLELTSTILLLTSGEACCSLCKFSNNIFSE